MAKQAKPKKLDAEKQWTVIKKIATNNMKTYLKDLKAEADGKEDLLEIKEQAAIYTEMLSKFKKGLTPLLKKIVNAKTLDDQVEKCAEARKIIKQYDAIVTKYNAQIDCRKKTTLIMGGMLARIDKDLDDTIKFAAKAQG